MTNDHTTFKQLVESVLQVSPADRQLLVNIIDPTAVLMLSSKNDLRDALLDETRLNQSFVVVDLSFCPGMDKLAEEAIVQFVRDLEDSKTDQDQKLIAAVRRFLIPWSFNSTYDLRREVEQYCKDVPRILVVRGLDTLPEDWDTHLLATARLVAACLRIPVTFLISERYRDCDVRIRYPRPTRAQFQQDVQDRIDAELKKLPPKGEGGQRNAAQSFWLRLAQLVFPTGDLALSKGGQQGRISRADGLKTRAELVSAATYPSRRLRDQAVMALRVLASDFRSRANDPKLKVNSSESGQTDAAPAGAGDEAVQQAVAAADEAVQQAVFLLLLEVAFPEVVHAAHSQSNGYYELFRLQLRLVADSGHTETALPQSHPWDQFSKDERLKSFFGFAMGTDDGTRRVLPFASATAIKRHSQLLSGAEVDQWKDLLKEISEQCRRAEGEATDLVMKKPVSWKLLEEERGKLAATAEKGTKLLANEKLIAARGARIDAAFDELAADFSDGLTALSASQGEKVDKERLQTAQLRCENLAVMYDGLPPPDENRLHQSIEYPAIATAASDAQKAARAVGAALQRLGTAAIDRDQTSGGGDSGFRRAVEIASDAWTQLKGAHAEVQLAVRDTSRVNTWVERFVSDAKAVDSAFAAYNSARDARSDPQNVPKIHMDALFGRAQSLWKETSRDELEPGDLIDSALRRLSFLEMVGLPDASWSEGQTDEWHKEIDGCIADLKKGVDVSQGMLALDAQLGIARAYTVRGAYGRALEQINRSQPSDRDELSESAVAFGRAFLQECQRSTYWDAEKQYEQVFATAWKIGARDLAARATYGIERCKLRQVEKEAWQPVSRAQAFLSIQLARSPFVPRGQQRKKWRLFISYRGENRPIVETLVEAIDQRIFDVWADFDVINPNRSEFRPEIQIGLDRSDGFLIVLSPDYSQSEWCTWELSTALARRPINGQRVDWIYVDADPAARDRKATDHARHLLNRRAASGDQSFFQSQLELVLSQPPLCKSVLTPWDFSERVGEIATNLKNNFGAALNPLKPQPE